MTTTGVTRKLDDYGKVAIPKVVRSLVGLEEGDTIEFFLDKQSIMIKKVNQDVENERHYRK